VKLSFIERSLVTAAAMPAPQARRVLMLICEAGLKGGDADANGRERVRAIDAARNVQSEGAAHYEKRRKFITRFQTATDRILDYAKHETLRNVEKHFRENPPHIQAAEKKPEPNSLAKQLTFDKELFGEELIAAWKEEQDAALRRAGQGLYDEIGMDDPFRLTDTQALRFIKKRENLLSNVPDEIHREIMDSINEGLEQGETRPELMARISSVFDAIKEGRAKTIANTETAAAFNYARDKAMRKAGVTHKKWLFSQSPLIKEHRETHVDAGGQIQPINEPFDVDGVKFMHPGDSSLGAGPEDIINCHCVAIPVEEP